MKKEGMCYGLKEMSEIVGNKVYGTEKYLAYIRKNYIINNPTEKKWKKTFPIGNFNLQVLNMNITEALYYIYDAI